MAERKGREYNCCVVNETVRIALRSNRAFGPKSEKVLFVRCNQDECQYVEENKHPCPLNLSMFKEEILQREQKAREIRENHY